jgi:hypothetical protein
MDNIVTGSQKEVLVAYIVVLEKEVDRNAGIPRGPFPKGLQPEIVKEMKPFISKKHVIDYVASLGKKGDTRKVKNIFSVNEYGVTYEQEIVFNGTLQLVSKLGSGDDTDFAV